MLKVNKKDILPTYFKDMRAGDTFLYEGNVYMMVTFNGRVHPINLERANVATNIHMDSRVTRCDCELMVLRM